MTTHRFSIAGREIGTDCAPFVIAELSCNHCGSLERAFEIMRAARTAGVDAIKLQTFSAETNTINLDRPDFYIRGGLWDGRHLYDLYKEAHTPWEWHEGLFQFGRELGIPVFSSPFSDAAVDFLEQLECPAYKIASFEIVDIPLVKRAAATGKPLIMSTGMASLEEITEAVNAAYASNCKGLALLHCVSGYPTPPEEADLRTIDDLSKRFNAVIGLSDHTLGTVVPIAAVAAGASIIEKHFTLSRLDGGLDAEFSVEPREMKEICEGVRTAWSALGSATYKLKPSEDGNKSFRRSIYVIKDIKPGDFFSEKNIGRIRPGYGLAPKFYESVLGKKACFEIAAGTPLSWDMVER
jgi:pseudaminic acid synthase